VSKELPSQFVEHLGVVRGTTRAGEMVEVDIEHGGPECVGELLDEHAHGASEVVEDDL
jgi:hypothetical protein